MTEAQRLADALEGLFARPDNGWFTPVSVAVAGLTAEQAASLPQPGFNSIWAVVNHLAYWHVVLLRRLRGEPPDPQAPAPERGWAAIPNPADEQAWHAACQRLAHLNEELAGVVAGLTDEALTQPIAPGRATRYQVIQGLIAHNCYHTAEIISLRHLQGLWLERT